MRPAVGTPRVTVCSRRVERGVPFLGTMLFPSCLRLDGRGRRRFAGSLRALEAAYASGSIGPTELQVRATAMSEAGEFPDDPELVPRMMAFHDEMAQAGVLLDGAGLLPSSQGFRLRYDAGGVPRLIDGPFAETKEQLAGFYLIEARDLNEAI